MLKVSDYIANRLAEAGIEHVFMISGGGAMHLNDSLGNHGKLQYVCNHHEQASAIAAEGYYRASGKLAAVCVTTGPGGTNTFTGVAGQYLDSIPCLYISGQVKRETLVNSYNVPGLRQLGDQEIDVVSMVAPITKYATQVREPGQIGWLLDLLLELATTPRFGPVWLDVPLDIQGAMIDPATLPRRKPTRSPLTTPLNKASQAAIIAPIVERLQQAKRPVIVSGHGVRLAQAMPELLRLLNLTGIPVVTTFNGHDTVPNECCNYVGRSTSLGDRTGNLAIQNSDFLLTVGSRNSIRQVSFNWKTFAREAYWVAVDVDAAELAKPTLRLDQAVQLDARVFLHELWAYLFAQPLPGRPAWQAWRDWLEQRRQRYPTVLPEYRQVTDGVHPYVFMETLTKTIPDDATIVAGDGSACVVLYQAGVVKTGQRQFWNSGCAAMGYDLPAAIGAAFANPKKPVICISGDGSLQLNLQELQTLKHHHLPVKIFVLNNGGYLSIKQTQDNFFKRRVACDATSGVTMPNLRHLARAYGITYTPLKSHTDMAETIQFATHGRGPTICEVFCSDYVFSPKLTSERLPGGRMVTKPLEDMWPFLPRDEFAQNMLIPPLKE